MTTPLPTRRESELAAELAALRTERDRLAALLDTPEVHDFTKAVPLEAAHQRKRWGSDHDAGKTDADWFWLIGYLAGKALHNPGDDAEKQLHRIVTVAAAAANWHAARLGKTNMRPGIATPPGEETALTPPAPAPVAIQASWPTGVLVIPKQGDRICGRCGYHAGPIVCTKCGLPAPKDLPASDRPAAESLQDQLFDPAFRAKFIRYLENWPDEADRQQAFRDLARAASAQPAAEMGKPR